MKMKQSFLNALITQNAFNSIVNPNWIDAGYNFKLAAIQEAHELIDHYPWKWWSKTKESSPFQKTLELADIFCFVLSDTMVETPAKSACQSMDDWLEGVARAMNNEYMSRIVVDHVLDAPKSLLGFCEEMKYNRLGDRFFDLLDRMGVSIEYVISIHRAKSILNKFRQANGYKEGAYIKMWHGEEDNCALEAVIDNYGALEAETDFELFVRHNLEAEYALVLRQQPKKVPVNPMMTVLNVTVCADSYDAVAKGYNYSDPKSGYKPIELKKVVVVREGTVGGNATVDFILSDENEQKYVFMTTGNMLKSIPC